MITVLSVRRKINLLYLATYVPLILLLMFLLVFYVYQWKRSETDSRIVSFYNDLYRIYTQKVPGNALLSLPGSDKMAFEIYSDGRLISSFHVNPGMFIELQKNDKAGFFDFQEFRVYVNTTTFENHRITFITAENIAAEVKYFRMFFVILFSGTGTVILLIWFFGERITKKLLTPVGEIGALLQKISEKGITGRRIRVKKTGREVLELEKAVNLSLDRIEELINEIKTISMNIAHELRTPLAAAKSSLEVALFDSKNTEDFKKRIAESVEELNRVIELSNALLSISKLENGGGYSFEEIDLSELLARVIEKHMTIHRELEFDLDLEPMVSLFGDKTLLESAVSCLVDNACKHSTDGIVKVVLRHSDDVEIIVSNKGSPIPEELQNRIFDKFVRGKDKSGGVGLGLYIASKIVRFHRGKLLYEHENGMNTFKMILPATLL
ncbi:sensor histidine kinase [Kosmotoga pacifica]|uniref:sensor histidine kinase n=1 Tax=Kosmotoga pacifica TaxID=1330330 RepID=UPI001C54FC25|nr:HAMP domain-containing sensor histidine kinase [Kosmotoga pacifica]